MSLWYRNDSIEAQITKIICIKYLLLFFFIIIWRFVFMSC